MRRPISVSPEVPLQTMLRDYWDEIADVAAAIDLACLERVAVMLLNCQARGRVVFVVGNGGSAATASHFACDLSKGTRRDGPPTFHVVSLTDNVPLLTAWANDSGYEHVFSEQLTALARPGDLLVAISASGNSPNVVAAIDAARSCGMAVVGLTGRSGGRLRAPGRRRRERAVGSHRGRRGRASRRRPQSVRHSARAARFRRDPRSHNQSLRRAGATRRPLKMKRGRHLNPEQRGPSRRYATETVESALPMGRHVLIWDGG